MPVKSYDVIERAPDKLLTIHTTDTERMVLYLTGQMDERYKPSKKLQQMIDDMQKCYTVYQRAGSRRKTVNMLTKTEGWSEKKAYNVWNKMNEVYPQTTHHDQAVNVDILLEQLQELYEDTDDDKLKARLLRQKADLIEKHMGNADSNLYNRIQPPQVVIQFMPEHFKTDYAELTPEQKLAKLEQFKKAKRKKHDIIEDAQIVTDGE